MAIKKSVFSVQPFLLILSACLALPILAVSAHVLSLYRRQHASNPWWLPVWRAHFDTHGLVGVISGSCVVFALDLVSIGVVVAGTKGGKVGFRSPDQCSRQKLIRTQNKGMTWAMVALMVCSAAASLVAVVMPAVTNSISPTKSDTVQTWTCKWKDAVGAPDDFESLCRQSVRVLSSFSSLEWLLTEC